MARVTANILINLPFVYIFYSPRAYKFVRKTLHFPHPAIRLGHEQEMLFVNQGFIESFGILI